MPLLLIYNLGIQPHKRWACTIFKSMRNKKHYVPLKEKSLSPNTIPQIVASRLAVQFGQQLLILAADDTKFCYNIVYALTEYSGAQMEKLWPEISTTNSSFGSYYSNSVQLSFHKFFPLMHRLKKIWIKIKFQSLWVTPEWDLDTWFSLG